MALLTDYTWATKYDSDTLSLIKEFYEPALNCAVRHDRSTGYFSARILTLAALGIEGLIRNHGVMRLIIGCTLREEEVDAIARGEKLREVVDRSVSDLPLIPENIEEANALELLSWVDGMRVTEPLAANFSFPHQSNPSINNSDISS